MDGQFVTAIAATPVQRLRRWLSRRPEMQPHLNWNVRNRAVGKPFDYQIDQGARDMATECCVSSYFENG